MDIPAPRANPILLGHAPAEAALAGALSGGRLHHAWLITGPEGIGKATLAYRFARWLLAGGPRADTTRADLALDPAHPVFRRVATGSHADLLTIERSLDSTRKRLRRQIVVDDVRRVHGFLGLTPAEGGWRVVMVDGADTLNPAAANALLKVLEEPPPRAVLLLTCAATGRLPATLLSRCRRLPLSPLGPPDMADLLARFLPDMAGPDRLRLAALAEGAPGRALRLAAGEGLRIATLVARVLDADPATPLAAARLGHETADALGRTDEAFTIYMELLRGTIAATIGEQVRGLAEGAPPAMLARRSLDSWAETWHALGRLQEETEQQALDRRQAVLSSLELVSAG